MSLTVVCFQIYWELLLLVTFPRVHSNLEELSYLSWQNTYPNLKTSCHIELNFFLWTKCLENLLLAKFLISVEAPLTLIRVGFFGVRFALGVGLKLVRIMLETLNILFEKINLLVRWPPWFCWCQHFL